MTTFSKLAKKKFFCQKTCGVKLISILVRSIPSKNQDTDFFRVKAFFITLAPCYLANKSEPNNLFSNTALNGSRHVVSCPVLLEHSWSL